MVCGKMALGMSVSIGTKPTNYEQRIMISSFSSSSQPNRISLLLSQNRTLPHNHHRCHSNSSSSSNYYYYYGEEGGGGGRSGGGGGRGSGRSRRGGGGGGNNEEEDTPSRNPFWFQGRQWEYVRIPTTSIPPPPPSLPNPQQLSAACCDNTGLIQNPFTFYNLSGMAFVISSSTLLVWIVDLMTGCVRNWMKENQIKNGMRSQD